MWLFFPLLLLLLLSGVLCTDGLYPHLLIATERVCETTSDCLPASLDWCQSGQTCLRERCHLIPNYPCPYFQHCDSLGRRCTPVSCRSHSECDDHIFCNGVESCINRTCTSDFKHDCSAGTCDERRQRCILPKEVTAHRKLSVRTATKTTSGDIVRMDVPTAAPTSSSGLTDNAVIAIICASVVVLAVVFILLVIALISK